MKQSLQLKIGQSLAMTPQLQQAIRLLQLSTVELQQEIQEALESNLMLEPDEASNNTEQESSETENDTDSTSADEYQEASFDEVTEIPSELAVDSDWSDVYDATPTAASLPADDNTFDFLQQKSSVQTLHEHLSWQLEMVSLSIVDSQIAEAIIDSINDDGYLSTSVESLFSSLKEAIDDLTIEEVYAVLHRIQLFDPVGVGACDLSECLTIQLKQYPEETPYLQQAIKLVAEHINDLGTQDQALIKKITNVSEEGVHEIICLIRTLSPKPGRSIAPTQTEYIVPEVTVKKTDGRWEVKLNQEVAPKIRINPHYSSLVQRGNNSADNTYLKNNLQDARWFLKCLQSRNVTLMKVATCIVKHQIEFLEHGDEAMKPLVLRDIAEDIEMHESTISRVTTQKYMHTPRGIYEFKYFFSSHVNTSDGGTCSATAIRALIKKFIDTEAPQKPLSDSKIAQLLIDQGIKVARRTIAKYRESMNIPSSNQRKRLL